jgi:hypothetical protein
MVDVMTDGTVVDVEDVDDRGVICCCGIGRGSQGSSLSLRAK